MEGNIRSGIWVLIVLVLAACGGNNTSDTGNSSPPNILNEAGNVSEAGNVPQVDEASLREENERAAMRSVLAQDRRFGLFADVRRRANDMRTIDLSGAPQDFRTVYLEYIHAAEALAAVDEELSELERERESGRVATKVLVEGSLRPGIDYTNRRDDALARRRRGHSALIGARNRVETIASAHGLVFSPREILGDDDAPMLSNVQQAD